MRFIKILNRPISPHLTIYSSQFTSVYSIWHRITGISLSLLIVFCLIFIKISSYNVYGIISNEYLTINLWIQNSIILNLLITFFYHVLNGLRHIIWDLGFNLPIKFILTSAIFIGFFLILYIFLLFYKILI